MARSTLRRIDRLSVRELIVSNRLVPHYDIYTAKITSGGAIPTPVEFQNSYNPTEVDWRRLAAGDYYFVLKAGQDLSKVWAVAVGGQTNAGVLLGCITEIRDYAGAFGFDEAVRFRFVQLSDNVAADVGSSDPYRAATVEIRVYPEG